MYVLFWPFFALAMLIESILLTPVYLRAGLSGDFGAAFSMEFYRDFMKRVGKEIVLAELFVVATGAFLSLGGCLLCYFGLFPAMTLLLFAHHHLGYQLYELYLERGGAPVPHKKAQDALAEPFDEVMPSSHIMQPQPEERSTDVRRPKDRR